METTLRTPTSTTVSRAAVDRAASVAEMNRVTVLTALGAIGVAVIALYVIGLTTANVAFMAGAGLLMVGSAMVGVYTLVNIEVDRTR